MVLPGYTNTGKWKTGIQETFCFQMKAVYKVCFMKIWKMN